MKASESHPSNETDSRRRKLRNWLASEPQVDVLAVIILLALCVGGTRLTWGRLYSPIYDQGWYMQVAARVAAGDVLYRDVIWMYGPLPVYMLGILFRWLHTHVAMLWLLYHSLAVLGCLLTYWVARFLLSGPMALLGTVAMFLGGWWGGFLSYAMAYTGAVPLGAVLGLLFLVSLLSYLRSTRASWLVLAGLATGGAILTKPEFALACAGTGFLLLSGLALFPEGLASNRTSAMHALIVYIISGTVMTLVGYGALTRGADWSDVWAGISGYDQDLILLQEWPLWGTPRSWSYIVSGLGMYLLAALALIGLLASRSVRKHRLAMVTMVGLGLVLFVLPRVALFLARPGLLSAMVSSMTILLQEWIQLIWAPGTTWLSVAIIALGIRYLRAYRRKQNVSRVEWTFAALVMYSALADVRSYLHPVGTFHFLYLDTLFPALVFAMVVLIPQALEGWWGVSVRRARAPIFVAVILLVYAWIGLAWDMAFLSQLNTKLVTPRGTALVFSDTGGRRPWGDMLGYILANTEPGDSIAVLGHAPGLYFLSGRSNPLRQDTILPGMGSSPVDVQEILRRLETHSPKLVIVPQGVREGKGWFWELDVGREAYQNLMPIWQYVGGHYRFQALVGGEEWGYAIYELRDRRP